MLGQVLAALLVVGISGSPMLRNLHIGSSCMMKCVADVENTTMEIDFAKTTNYGQQLADIDKTCMSIADARDCVAKCDVPLNPFDMKSMKTMCSDTMRADLKKHSACYNEQGNATTDRCNKMCGSMNDSEGALQGKVFSSNVTDGFNFSALFDSLGDVCTIAKCHARCSRDAFSELCRQTDPTAGVFLQQFSEDVLKAMNDDLNQFGMRTLMKGMLPKQCYFIFNPGQLFNETAEMSSTDSPDEESEGLRNLFSEMFKSLSSSEEEKQKKESKLKESEMRLLDKQERNLDKQIEKLNLEIELLSKKLMT